MAVWTCAVTTRALREKQFFRCRPLVLAFHTYLTWCLATRKFYPCGRISLWGTGFGECRCWVLRRFGSIVTTDVFGSVVFLSWSWLVGTLVCSSFDFCKFLLVLLGGSPVPFLGPAHQGLTFFLFRPSALFFFFLCHGAPEFPSNSVC